MREEKTGMGAKSFHVKNLLHSVMILYRALTEAYILLRIKGNYKNV